jgi:nucleotide-binding universal stress UspA family protein
MSIFPTKILLATDGSEDAELAATTAVGVARSTASELHVVHTYRTVPSVHFDALVRQEMEREAQGVLDGQVKQIEGLGGSVAQARLSEGGAAEEIAALAEEIGAGLITVGSRGRGRIRRLLVGSVSDAVVRHAHCPVMVVRWKPVVFPAKILLATDGSEEATLALQTAADLSERTGSELHVIHVGEVPLVYHPERHGYGAEYEEHERGARQLLEAQVGRMKAAGGTVAQAHLSMGRADEEIVVLAEELGADLVAVGSRGLGGVRRAMVGSVSDSVVRHAHCPVLVVRPRNEHASEHEEDLLT